MRLTLTKLNQAGFSHVVLPLAFLAVGVGVVAFAGSRITGSSSAATVADICGSGYTKQGEHWLLNTKTSEQSHFKVIVAAKGSSRCLFTMGTGVAANESNHMVIDAIYSPTGQAIVHEYTHDGTYKGRTPTIHLDIINNNKVKWGLNSWASRNGNANAVGFHIN